MKMKFFATATFLMITSFAAVAGTQPHFINVDMTAQEAGEPVNFKLRIPMSLLNAMAPQLEQAFEQATVENEEFNLREMWAQIKDSGPMRFAEIDGPDAKVIVETTENHLQVAVDSADEGEINLKLPLALGAVLFEQETMDVESLTSALENLAGEDLLTIEGDKVQGRIWVD